MVYAEGPRSQSLMKQLYMKQDIYCRLTSAEFDQLEQCLGGYNFTLSTGYAFIFLVKYFLPPWEYAI